MRQNLHRTSGAKEDREGRTICKEGIVDEAIYSLHVVEDSEWLRGFLGRGWELNAIVIFHRGLVIPASLGATCKST